jgi:hypothetical protein
MQIDIDMSFEQYFEANQLFCRKSTTSWRRFNYWMLIYGYPVLGAVFALLAVQLVLQRAIVGALIEFLCSIFFFWARFRYPARIRKIYDQQAKDLAGVMTLSLDGLRFERKNGTANADFKWVAFDRWIDKPDMFMILTGPVMFYRIPKDKLTSAEQEQVRGWLSSSKLLS